MLSAGVIAIKNIDLAAQKEMYALFEQYYAAVDVAIFESDLQEKNYAILLRSTDGSIKGFSTLKIMSAEIHGKTPRAVFSGDTILDRDYWGSQALSKAWCELAGAIKAQHTETPLYWFLIVKGHRTYRYLSVFSHQFYPNRKTKTPVLIRKMIDHLGQLKFGEAYVKDKGIVHYKEPRGYLRDSEADILQKHKNHPDVNFFLSKNPNYQRGDELVCITELCEENLRSVARQMFVKGMRQDLLKHGLAE